MADLDYSIMLHTYTHAIVQIQRCTRPRWEGPKCTAWPLLKLLHNTV